MGSASLREPTGNPWVPISTNYRRSLPQMVARALPERHDGSLNGWVDAIGDDAAGIDSLLRLFAVDVTAAWILRDEPTDPSPLLHGTYFHLHADTIETIRGRERRSSLDLIAGRNFVISPSPTSLRPRSIASTERPRDRPLAAICSGILSRSDIASPWRVAC